MPTYLIFPIIILQKFPTYYAVTCKKANIWLNISSSTIYVREERYWTKYTSLSDNLIIVLRL
jgi:hypothetical protein